MGALESKVARIVTAFEFGVPPGLCSVRAGSADDMPGIKGATPSPSAELRRNFRRPIRRKGSMVRLLGEAGSRMSAGLRFVFCGHQPDSIFSLRARKNKSQCFFSSTRTQSANVGAMGGFHEPAESGVTSSRLCSLPDLGSK